MKKSTRNELLRVFGNRYSEKHPLKHCSAGVEWLARSLPLVKTLTKDEIDNFLVPLIDDLLARIQDDCELCTGKLLAYAEIYCSHGSTSQALKYWQLYHKLMKKRSRRHAKFRDFKSEVYIALQIYLEDGQRG